MIIENALDKIQHPLTIQTLGVKFLSLTKSICKRTSTLNIILHGEILSKPRMSALTISVQHCSVSQSHTIKKKS